MAQKIVIKVQMASEKCRSKAMALVAKTGGVDSVALAGEGKDQVVVVGNVDSVKLTSALRKKVGFAQLVEVGEAKKEKEEKKPVVAVIEPLYLWHYPYPYPEVVYEYPPPPGTGTPTYNRRRASAP